MVTTRVVSGPGSAKPANTVSRCLYQTVTSYMVKRGEAGSASEPCRPCLTVIMEAYGKEGRLIGWVCGWSLGV